MALELPTNKWESVNSALLLVQAKAVLVRPVEVLKDSPTPGDKPETSPGAERNSGGKTQRIARLLLLLSFTCLGTFAWAANDVTWNLQNAVFSDGGTATGSLVFDTNTDTIVSYDISTSGGDTSTYPAFVFQNGAPDNTGVYVDTPNNSLEFDTDIALPSATEADLQLRLPTYPLPATGGTVAFDLSNGYQGECYDCDPWRPFVSGDVTSAVPEPGTVTLLGCGLFGLVGMLRRKIAVKA